MTARLTNRDWELISAYLDGALSAEDTRRIEARLSKEADFREAYQSLMRTRGILRSTPVVKRHRNFFLTPEMVQIPRWYWLIPVFNFGSAIAAVLAILFLVMDILPAGKLASPVSPARESASMIQSTGEPGQMKYSAEVPAPRLDGNAGAENESRLPTAVNAIPAEGMVAGQITGMGAAPLENKDEDQLQPPMIEAPAAAAAPMHEPQVMESAASVGISEADQMAAPPAGGGIPTAAAQMKAAPTETVVAGLSAVPTMTVSSYYTSIPTAAAALLPPPATATLSTAHVISTPTVPVYATPSLGKEKVETAEFSRTWQASFTGGILLLLSAGLAAAGIFLRRQFLK
ncbi:MAG: hypothetical protein GYA15_09965 [Leptolinea sp.]|jgi:hypothetical protein|nr:hypothetical protein [Leptolinea sp.]